MDLATYIRCNFDAMLDTCAKVLAGMDTAEHCDEVGVTAPAGFDWCDGWPFLAADAANRYRQEAALRIGATLEAATHERGTVDTDRVDAAGVGADIAFASCGSGGGSGYADLPTLRGFNESPRLDMLTDTETVAEALLSAMAPEPPLAWIAARR